MKFILVIFGGLPVEATLFVFFRRPICRDNLFIRIVFVRGVIVSKVTAWKVFSFAQKSRKDFPRKVCLRIMSEQLRSMVINSSPPSKS